MDRLNQLRAGAEAGRGDATLDTSSPPSEAYMSANESSSKYFSLTDSTFDISPIKDVSLASAASVAESDHTMTDPDELLSNLSPIAKKDVMLDSFKIGNQIEAANILSGGVDIFEDNDNSFDGDELVIDDNVDMDDKGLDDKTPLEEAVSEGTLVETHVDTASKKPEVLLQIDGKNVDAIDIGNGLYLYRKEGLEELAAVQIITEDDQQTPCFKFLKVRENVEGNLEVYEEFEIEVSKDAPMNETKPAKKTPHVPIKDINKGTSEISHKVAEKKDRTPPKEVSISKIELESEKELEKTELNLNGKMMKFSESRKSPVVGSFTPMTYHSTPSKEGKPLTKTMVDQQLHPNRHSDNVKKTIEVHTDNQNKKLTDESNKQKSESQKKNVTDIVTKDTLQGGISENQDKIDLNKDDVRKTSAETDKKELRNATKTSDEVVKPVNTKVSIEVERQDKETGPSKALEVDMTESEVKEKPMESEQNISKPKDSVEKFVLDEAITVFPSTPLQKSIADKTVASDDTILAEIDAVPTKDSKNPLNKDAIVAEVDKPKTNEVDQTLEKSKEVDQKEVKLSGKVPETTSNNLLSSTAKESTKQFDTVSQKESSETNVAISLDQTQTSDLIKIQKDSKGDIMPAEKASVVSYIPKASKSKITEKKETITEKLEESEMKIVDIEKPHQAAKATELKTDGQAEQQINAVAQVNEINETIKATFETGKTNQVEYESQPKGLPNTEKLTKTVSDIEMLPVSKGVALKSDLQLDKLNLVMKPIEDTIAKHTVSKIENLLPDPKETKSLTTETNVEKKLEPKIVSQTNKIPVAKAVEPKTLTKPLLNPVEKKIEPAVPKTHKIIADPKANKAIQDPKTYLKLEKPLFSKIEPEAIPKVEAVNPTPKVFEVRTVPKPSKIVKVGPVPQVPKSSAVIITSNKIIAPSRVDSLANVELKIPEASNPDPKRINNNHAAVPFGKWTDANRQEFLNKFKEIKAPASSHTKQIKNSNDLNRIDVLKKIDSQRSNTNKADKSNVKDTVFSTKIAPPKVETKIPVKNEGLKVKVKPVETKSNPNQESVLETASSIDLSNVTPGVVAPIPEERREVNVNDLIGKAIVDMLNRPVPMPMTRSQLDEPRHVESKEDAHITMEKNGQQIVNIDQQKPKCDSDTVNVVDQILSFAEQYKLKSDQQKPNIDQQTLRNDPQKLNVDQKKPKRDESILKIDQKKLNSDQQKLSIEQKIDEDSSGSLDDIEMKMNELHGIPFVERPPHELPRVHKTYSKSKDTQSKPVNKLLPATSKQNLVQNNVIDLESDEEVIEHEPVTGDIDLTKKPVSKLPAPIKHQAPENKEQKQPVFTENDFDKFARRNSISFEDCLTVKYDGKEPANVVQTVKEKDAPKIYPRNEGIRFEAKTKLPPKQTSSQIHPSKIPNTKFGVTEDPNNKNYQSKIHTAYQSALTAKRQLDRPIPIIEDKPVKVVFMDANAEFVPNQLNVQGKELSPAKKAVVETMQVSPQAVSTDVTDTIEDKQDDTKAKTKHQRKQVLTPVEAPDLELIQPRDIGLEESPKKKRKTDDNKTDKSLKNLVHKKSYLLGRAGVDEKSVSPEVITPVKETINRAEIVTERTVSAFDNLVKAAELLENQSVHSASPNPDCQQNTPMKRGRGRPRKYPLPEGNTHNKVVSPSPQKKPRLIDAKPVKRDPISDEESSDEGQMIRENWTMGKINENIVCPICNKLFRSENVVFKHVKHCTGVSPTRSELEKRSPRRRRYSLDSDKSFDSRSEDMEFDEKPKERKNTSKKVKSKESPVSKSDEVDVIVIEDTSVKEAPNEGQLKSKTTEEKYKPVQEPSKETKQETREKQKTPQKPVKEKTLKEIADEKSRAKMLEEVPDEKQDKEKKVEKTEEKVKPKKLSETTVRRSSNLMCEFCGKTFRQLSYLTNHKLQHKKEQLKKLEAKLTAKLQVFSCEVCKKEFRKLHHLVQHRIIHNPEVPTRTTRKSSSEQSDSKVKEQPAPKQNDDTSAGFRCEPCDKSFRKLHHLVEHRETHDGINRQKTNAQVTTQPIEKPAPPPQCDVCKKSFRKLHHLIEHKEQHHVEQVETSSEKSDDKSVQSSLSTRDIIHECSLCYMVFPNEHSLNKHFIICQQKKKRQSKAKDKPQIVDGVEIIDESTIAEDGMDTDDEPKTVVEEIIDANKDENEQDSKIEPEKIEIDTVNEKPADTYRPSETDKSMDIVEISLPKQNEVSELKSAPAKRDLPKSDDGVDEKKVVPEKIKKIDDQHVKEVPKKTPIKDKVAPTVTKRQKSLAPLPVLPEGKSVESSDDEEVRYMLNPNFKPDETSEGKVFMKIRSNKRNSLQIERPNSRELMSRRTSLQHPPKIPRLKAKAVEPKVVPTVTKNVPKPKTEAASTDSDDSDVKYSFPETVTEPALKLNETPKQKKAPRKSLAEKRKSLGGIAKRKSLGQAIAKLKPNTPPVRIIKRRTLDVEHRCDCGQLFNSAALLTRHTSLAHTPPRIRRRRSPPPEPSAKPSQQPTKATKASVLSEASNSKPARKSSVKSDTPETRKSTKPQTQEKPKARRSGVHRGVPVPEKMRKLMMKSAK